MLSLTIEEAISALARVEEKKKIRKARIEESYNAELLTLLNDIKA